MNNIDIDIERNNIDIDIDIDIERNNSHYHFHQLYMFGMIIELTVFAHIWANIITHALWG